MAALVIISVAYMIDRAVQKRKLKKARLLAEQHQREDALAREHRFHDEKAALARRDRAICRPEDAGLREEDLVYEPLPDHVLNNSAGHHDEVLPPYAKHGQAVPPTLEAPAYGAASGRIPTRQELEKERKRLRKKRDSELYSLRSGKFWGIIGVNMAR